MTFKKGESGNPQGRAKGVSPPAKSFKEALQVAVQRADGNKTKLARIAEALVEKAAAGDVQAANVIADRLDGKPSQPIEHTGSALEDLLGRIAGRSGRKPPEGA